MAFLWWKVKLSMIFFWDGVSCYVALTGTKFIFLLSVAPEWWNCGCVPPPLALSHQPFFFLFTFLHSFLFFLYIILLSSIEVFWIASSIEIWRDSVCFKRTFSALSGKLDWNSRIRLLLSKIKSTSWFNSSQHTFTKHDVQITGI